jgi:hypothetical protein
MRNRKAPRPTVMAASMAILDRGHGKPTQPLAGDAELPPLHPPSETVPIETVRDAVIGVLREWTK